MKGRDAKPQKLITNGLYGYVRHPLYTSGLVIIWLLPVMTARLLVIDLALTVYIVVGAFVEERKLRHKFGQEYIEYSRGTPMFIPFLKKPRNWMGL
jgi:protein-S-isoprenylcysteine O-methyltransferase Ste14